MLARFSERLAAFFRATAPDPFVIAVLLTLATIGLAVMLTGVTLGEAAALWAGTLKAGDGSGPAPGVFGADGLWAFLKFSMQMCLILVTGHVLASSAPVAAGLRALSALPRTAAQAAALVSLAGCALGLLNWGLGLVCGAVLARRVFESMRERRPGAGASLPLLAAAGYTPMLVWHGGFSGTAPLTVTSAEGIRATLGPAASLLSEPVALSRTLLSPMNLIVSGGLLVIVPLVMAMMASKEGDAAPAPAPRVPPRAEPARAPAREDDGPPGLIPRVLENTPIINIALAALIAPWALGFYLPASGPSGVQSLGLDAVNLTMLAAGLLLHGTPRRFLSAVDEAARHCGGIIVQFPLYAGIMAVMVGSGLAARLAEGVAGAASAQTLPVLTFLGAGLVNLFIPSGGGQWAVQGPVALEAARALDVDPARVVMAVAYGDQLTNMLQPFWALPLLAITGARAREIIGYTAVAMGAAGAWMALWLLAL